MKRGEVVLCARRLSRTTGWFLPAAMALLAPVGGWAQATGQAGAAAPNITSAWDTVLTNVVPSATPDPALTQNQPGGPPSAGDNFLNHFFFEDRLDYERFQVSFSGNPTTSSVIDAPNTGIFNPAGIPYPPAFQTGANRVYSFLDFGTRGWLNDRLNTHVAILYDQDLTHVNIGADAEDLNEVSPATRRFELLDANFEINFKPTDGFFSNTSIQAGRLNVYGAEIASFDGGAFTFKKHPKWELQVFGGRRYALFSDPVQRAIGGADLVMHLGEDTTLALDTLWYIRGINKATFRHRFNPRWVVASYFRSYGGAPVDFQAQAAYASKSGGTTVRAGFFQKLSADDYSYDYTINATDLNPNNPQLRLYLGPIEQYSQFTLDLHKQLLSNLRAGGSVIIRRLNNNNDQGPYDTSFEDYQVSAQYFPFRKIEFDAGYHQRNSDRLSPLGATTFDDVNEAGETSVKDLTGTLSRAFGEGRFYISGGMYYRRISMQDRFYYLNNLHQSGGLFSAWYKVDRHTRVSVDWSLDNDFFLLEPDLKYSQDFRVGLIWKY